MVKPAMKATKAIEKLHKLVEQLKFYMYSNDNRVIFKDSVIDPAQEIEDYIREISTDKKIDHIRLIKKWKID